MSGVPSFTLKSGPDLESLHFDSFSSKAMNDNSPEDSKTLPVPLSPPLPQINLNGWVSEHVIVIEKTEKTEEKAEEKKEKTTAQPDSPLSTTSNATTRESPEQKRRKNRILFAIAALFVIAFPLGTYFSTNHS